jgi:hypothetical protein
MSPQRPLGYPLSALQNFVGKFSRGESVDLNDCELVAGALFRVLEKHLGLEEARRIFSRLGLPPTPGLLRDIENAALLDRYDTMQGRQSVRGLAWQLAKEKVRGIWDPESHAKQLRRLLKERNAIPGQEELHRNLRAELEALRRDVRETGQSVEELAQQLATEGTRGISDPSTHEEYIWRVLREQSADTIEAVRSVLESLRSRLKDTE